jgi:hypothetical protein
MKQIIWILIVSAILFACRKTHDDRPVRDPGYNYFPLEPGNVNFYKVTEIDIDTPAGKFDTLIYYLKTVNDSPHYDLNNRLVTPVSRYIKLNPADSWVIKDVWFAYKHNNHLVVSEENIHFIKMIFPVADGSKWNGNSYNTLPEQEYKVAATDMYLTLSGFSYDSVLTVLERNDTSLIHKYYHTERYAKGIGLVERVFIDISQAGIVIPVPPNPILPIEKRIIRGTLYKQERIMF